VRAPAMSAAMGRAIEHLHSQAKTAPSAPLPPAQPPAPSPAPPAESLPPGLSEAELLASLDADEAASANSEETLAVAPEMLEKITAIFLRETPRRFESMRAALARQDATTLGMEAHTLKSNSRYLNAVQLSELCARMEKLADHGQLNEIEPLLGETEQVYAALRERLHQSQPA